MATLCTDFAIYRHWLILFFTLLLGGCAAKLPLPPPIAPAPVPMQERIPSYGGPRRVVIDKSEQRLRAYDGDRLVFSTRVSTGKEGKRTPNGNFSAQYKDRMHYSSLYDNAPMPFSVQFSGNYFLHGYSYVPFSPASHGCIRLPMKEPGRNPAKLFYEWVRPGTPIAVVGKWGG